MRAPSLHVTCGQDPSIRPAWSRLALVVTNKSSKGPGR